MLKRLISILLCTLMGLFVHISSAAAVELDQSTRTVVLNPEGQETILSLKELENGKRLFNSTCSKCHAGGRTKTNPNVGLSLDSLSVAEPPRDSVVAIVDYLKHPTTYDGEEEITLFHPNTERTDLYPEMRNLSDDDLTAMAGYILVQPKIRGVMWGGGKVYN